MSGKYKSLIENTKKEGGIFDVLLAIQKESNYVTKAGIVETAEAFGMSPAHVYDAASFYSMLRFEPPSLTEILICRGAPCHVAGAVEVIAAIEKELGIKIGEKTEDGKYSFDYTECLGQCQAAPTVLVNGKLYTDITPKDIPVLLEKGGTEESWKS